MVGLSGMKVSGPVEDFSKISSLGDALQDFPALNDY